MRRGQTVLTQVGGAYALVRSSLHSVSEHVCLPLGFLLRGLALSMVYTFIFPPFTCTLAGLLTLGQELMSGGFSKGICRSVRQCLSVSLLLCAQKIKRE